MALGGVLWNFIFQIRFKWGKNIGQFAWRPKYALLLSAVLNSMNVLSSLATLAQEVRVLWSGERATILRYAYLAYLTYLGTKIKRNF